MSSPEAHRLVVWDQIRKQFGITLSRDSARRLWRSGRFPVPVRLGHHRLAWRVKDIEEWLINLPSADDSPLRRKKIHVSGKQKRKK
jgi:predicted DNA-binding transcriptional regulator AlpA